MNRKERLTIQNQKSKIKSHDLYRRPKFLTVLHEIRETMSREADYDVDLFAEMVRSGARPKHGPARTIGAKGNKRQGKKEAEFKPKPMMGADPPSRPFGFALLLY